VALKFGRVTGVVTFEQNTLGLVVTLETSANVETIRAESVPLLRSNATTEDLRWMADQYTQETIGNELALLGWEAIGVASESRVGRGTLAPSATYIVRQL
jgi:hypothetical protein